jgi:hypothetical protein
LENICSVLKVHLGTSTKKGFILSLVVGFHKFNPTYWLKRNLFFVSFVVKTTGLEKGLKNIPITGHKSPSRPFS